MVVLQFLFHVEIFIASVSNLLHLHMPPWPLALGLNSLRWFTVSLVFYLEVCHKGVGFSSSLYNFSKWPATCGNNALTKRISICRFHSWVALHVASLHCHFFPILHLLLLISLLSTLKLYICLWSQLLTKVLSELICLSIWFLGSIFRILSNVDTFKTVILNPLSQILVNLLHS